MVKIRLRRTGAKKRPTYRIIIADSRSPRDGRFIEIIGHYNPRTDPPTIKVHEDRALHWLSVGAQPTDSVNILFNSTGTTKRFERLKAGEALESIRAGLTDDIQETSSDAEAVASPEETEEVEEDAVPIA